MQQRLKRIALTFLMVLTACASAAAQDEAQPRRQQPRNDTSHEVQIHLLVTAQGAEDAPRVPPALDGVVRQLKSSLPPADYRLAATFINRVRDGGAFEVKSVGASFFGPAQAESLTPSFFTFAMSGVKLDEDGPGQKFVNIQSFRLGLKVPIQTAVVGGGDKSATGYPVIQYEDTGVSTQLLSVREGEPTLVGTLSTRRPGQLFILVITVKRTDR